MKKIVAALVFLMTLLLIPFLCQASTTVLTSTSPDHTVISGNDEQIYGTSTSNTITLESGARAELINFPGSNGILIQSDSSLFTVLRSGTIVTFEGSDDTVLIIPVTGSIQTISFADSESLTLSIHDNQIMLDDQVIDIVPAIIGSPVLSANPTIQSVGSSSGTTIFSVTNTGTGSMTWTAEVVLGNDWLTITEGETGSNTGTITCQFEANLETTSRTGTVRITALNASGNPMDLTVQQEESTVSSDGCGAYVVPGVWKKFDCYNLGAIGETTDDNPLSPSWRLIGGYWQWGRNGPYSTQWHNTNSEYFAHGPTGPDSHEANETEIAMWNQEPSPDDSWSDTEKTINDPCPSGFRMPTQSQWKGVIENNTQTVAGSWSLNVTNYSSARLFGKDLMLPAAGIRNFNNGALSFRGISGYYWSSTKNGSETAGYMNLNCSLSDMGDGYTTYGYSVRCIAEPLSLSRDQVTLQSGESAAANISGGTGQYASATSSNDKIAIASLENNTITIQGISPGTAAITVEDSGGSTAFLTAMVDTSPYSCGAFVAPNVWKVFDCYNLAAIGKTTYDDPFAPSWRLIGGYWQWGRKGPGENQWHDTNTEHFAHGPTSAFLKDANDSSISGWSGTWASDGAGNCRPSGEPTLFLLDQAGVVLKKTAFVDDAVQIIRTTD